MIELEAIFIVFIMIITMLPPTDWTERTLISSFFLIQLLWVYIFQLANSIAGYEPNLVCENRIILMPHIINRILIFYICK